MTEEKKSENDIFIADDIYPDAKKLFKISLKPLETIKSDCFVVLDTNVLLVPYTINPKSLDDIKETYKRLIDSNRLLIPAQVAREFAKNRANKLQELYQQLSRKRNKISNLHSGRYPLLEQLSEYKDLLNLEKDIDDKINKYRSSIGSILEHVCSWRWDDPISNIYRELFKEEIIQEISTSRDTIQSDLFKRQKHKIPPGYKDSSKDDLGIGDLLIWYTIIEIAQTHKKSVIFVSGDEKADWWYQSENEALYPRFELVYEFYQKSEGQSFHILQFSDFLNLFGAEKEVVEEVRKEEVQRKSTYTNIDDIRYRGEIAEKAIAFWIQSTYSLEEIEYNRHGFLDFLITLKNQDKIGIVVRYMSNSKSPLIYHRMRETLYQGYFEVNEGRLNDFQLYLVTNNEEDTFRIAESVERYKKRLPRTNIFIGFIDKNNKFILTTELHT